MRSGNEARGPLSGFTRWMNGLAASPAATLCALVSVVLWAASGPLFHYSSVWWYAMNGVTQVLTFVMIFVVNHTQWHDTIAINTKLDALILAIESADNRAIGIEHAAEHVTERLREDITDAVQGA